MAEKSASAFFLTTMNHGEHWIFEGKGRSSLDNPEGITLRLGKEWLLPITNLSLSLTSWKQINTPAQALRSTEAVAR